MSTSNSFDAFISYSTADKQVADAVKQYLQSDGIRCWKAPDDIDPGRQWPEQIANAIDKCTVMVLVWSLSSMQSKEVAKELTLAMSSGLTVIPLRIEDIQPEGSFKYHLSGTHWLDLFDRPLEISLSDLSKQVQVTLTVANKTRGKTSECPTPSTVHISEPIESSSEAKKQNKENKSPDNPQLEDWREQLTWLLRSGRLRSIDQAALVSMAKSMKIEIDIDTEMLTARRDINRFESALAEFLESNQVDNLSAVGLDAVRKASCISKKEAKLLLSSLAESRKISILEKISVEWIDHCLESILETKELGETTREVSDHVTTSKPSNEETFSVIDFDQCISLNETDQAISGWWEDNIQFNEEIQAKIESLLGKLVSSSGIIWTNERITPTIESKVRFAHRIEPKQYGRLLLRLNTSTFSGKNGVLVFERSLSIKDMWENASHHYYCDPSNNNRVSVEITSIESGFSLVLNKVSSESKSKISSKVHTFSSVSDWNDDSSAKVTRYLPPLVEALSEFAVMQMMIISQVTKLERLFNCSEEDIYGNYNVWGADYLALNEKQSINAAKNICNQECDPSDLYLVLDTSLWHDCKEGIAFSRTGLYQKTMFSKCQYIPWSSVTEIVPPTREKLDIWINDVQINLKLDDEKVEDEDKDWNISFLEHIGAIAFASKEWFGLRRHEDEFRDFWLGILADAYHKNSQIEQSIAVRKMEYAAIKLLPSEEQSEKLPALLSKLSNAYADLSMEPERVCCLQKLLDLYTELINFNEGKNEQEERLNRLLLGKAQVLTDLTRYNEAIAIRRQELEWRRKVEGNMSKKTLNSIKNLGDDLIEAGQAEEAEVLFNELVSICENILDNEDFEMGLAYERLALSLKDSGKFDDALLYYRKALDHRVANEGDSSFFSNLSRYEVADVLLCLARQEEALREISDLEDSLQNMSELDEDSRELLNDALALRQAIESSR